MPKDPEPKMEAEPAVYYQGEVSDASEHEPMLANPLANKMADDLAAEQAREIGFSEEEIAQLIYGK